MHFYCGSSIKNISYLTSCFKQGVGRIQESTLNHFAKNPGPVASIAEKFIKKLIPRFFAVVAFRRGHLGQANDLASKDKKSRVFVRSQQMLDVLNGHYPNSMHVTGTKQKFNNRVLFAVHSAPLFDPNGYSVRTCQILHALQRTGLHVVTATRLGYPWDFSRHNLVPEAPSSTFNGIEFFHTPHSHGIRLPDLDYIDAYAANLSKMLKLHRCSVIHAHSNFLNGLAAVKAAEQSRCHSIYEIRGLWHLTRASAEDSYAYTEHFKYCETMEVLAAKKADRVVVLSEALRSWLVSRGVIEQKICVIGNAANVPYSKRSYEGSRGRSSLQIGYIGALARYEGIEILLQALAILISERRHVKLTIAGDGPDRARLQLLSKKLNLGQHTRFLGRISDDEVAELYKTFDVCPLPRSRYEVSELVPPLKTYEIMAHGVPLIVSNLPPLVEIAPHMQRGWVVEADNPKQLAIGLVKSIEEPEIFEKLARNAGEWVSRSANWTANSSKYMDVYATIDDKINFRWS